MKALMYYGPENMKVVEIPEPKPKENEVKLEIRYVGICGSDVHGYLGTTGRRIPPMIMGHEFSAAVVEVGGKVTKFKAGDRVTALPILNCGTCDYCRAGLINACENREFMGTMSVNGVLAEYVCADEKILYRLPDSLDDKTAALIEPFAVAYHALGKAEIQNKNVLIAGAGTIGLFALTVARYFGASKTIVTDLSPDRLAAAKKAGADIVINPREQDVGGALEKHGLRKSVDVTVEAVGITPTAQQTINLVRNMGTVIWIGNSAQMIEINMQQIVTRELTVKGTYVYIQKDYEESIKLLGGGDLDISGFISAVVGMDKAEEMFQRLAKGDTSMVKVLVDVRA
jgi:2-desacetyl-2-hydroxyethyl bacteriochlorophyllide A dehydrogenase